MRSSVRCVIEVLQDAPPGTLGFRISGHLTREDYTDVLVPRMREAVKIGQPLRLLVQIDSDFDGLEPGAVWEDIKTGAELGIGHMSAWERTAIVTDVDWLRRAMSVFGWMTPGEARVFGLSEREQAEAWLTGGEG